MADKEVKENDESLKKSVSEKKKNDVVEEKITKKKRTDMEEKVVKTSAEKVKAAEKEIDIREQKAVKDSKIEEVKLEKKESIDLQDVNLNKTDDNIKDNTLSNKTSLQGVKKNRDSKLPYLVVGIVVIALVVMLYIITKKVGFVNPPVKVESSVIATSASKESIKKETGTENLKHVDNMDVLKNKLDIEIQEPKNAKNIEYSIQGENVACITYVKSYTDDDGSEVDMDFVMKSSYSQEDNMAGVTYQWGTPIIMTTICDDASEVEVRSNVAIEDNFVMKAEWMDNSLYYTMTTSSLYTREEFLQEVNRVIIANHIEF